MNRTYLINYLIRKYSFSNYLEIGVNKGTNFSQIICENKTGVDPDFLSLATHKLTSDEFFFKNTTFFDLIFIDGLHHKDQVEKDIYNSLKFIKQGFIILHDCNPTTEAMQIVPRMQQGWTGDVWKAFAKFKYEWDYNSYVLNIDHGCGIIEVDNPRTKQREYSKNLTYVDLEKDRSLIGLISLENWHLIFPYHL